MKKTTNKTKSSKVSKSKTTKNSKKTNNSTIKKTKKKTTSKSNSGLSRKKSTSIKNETATKKSNVIKNDNFQVIEKSFQEPIVEDKLDEKYNRSNIPYIIIAILAILLLSSIYVNFEKPEEIIKEGDKIVMAIPYDSNNSYKNIWNEYHDKTYIKDDYVGQIIFESKIINEPVMQTNSNNTYLNRNYETYEYEICGPVFMDYECDADNDQNIVLYGHNRSTSVDPNHVMLFSPLHILENKNNYEENKIIFLVYEDHLDTYLITHVYSLKAEEDENGIQYLGEGEPLYYLDNYSNDEFEEYVKAIEDRQYYDTGIDISYDDKLLTLQTCFEDSLDKLIVVAKRIDSKQYSLH